jgi:hypothetical protein
VGRGPGGLQRRIISELARQPTKRLPWDGLKRLFPEEVRQRTFYRAVRGLRRRGLVYDECGGTQHWLELTVLGDDEFLELCRTSIGLLEAAARARPADRRVGLSPENSGVLAVDSRMWALSLLLIIYVIK